jgi:sensor histidine kinase YesM
VGQLIYYQGGEPEQWLAAIGDMSISQHWVLTPTGPHPIRGSVWTVTDMSYCQESISTTGVVLAILFVWFCLLGLLFLLMKDRRMVGYIEVTVQGSGFHHSTLIPARGPQSVTWVHQQVNYARALAAAA